MLLLIDNVGKLKAGYDMLNNVSFKGTYVIPYGELNNMDKQNKEEYGRKSAEIIMQGGKIEQTNDGVKVTVPLEKEQEYLAMLAKYNLKHSSAN